MSTEHQQYSIENQQAAIQRFAEAHGITIVRSFIDAGKSGVSIHGRDALQDLLKTVESGQADFSTILVYDVSRWVCSTAPEQCPHPPVPDETSPGYAGCTRTNPGGYCRR